MCPRRAIEKLLPAAALAAAPPPLPELAEPEIVRHYVNLASLNMSVDANFYPLGSCTMKYNPKRNERLAALPGMAALHPYQPQETLQGILELLYAGQQMLAEIAGLEGVSLQPAAGAHGEFAALLVAAAYFRDLGQKRSVVLIPDGAHGTNPASAVMAGFQTVAVKSAAEGFVNVGDLAAHLDDRTAAFMITNPNTLGMFEPRIVEIARRVHDAGGLVYLDGANMNAILGIARPGDFGADLMHFNPHKTFSGPHGGGGPGAGPIAVAGKLAPYLPSPIVVRTDQGYRLDYDRPKSIGRVRSFLGNVGVLVRMYCYLMTHGPEGLRRVAENAVLNANYLLARVKHILPGAAGRPLHARVRRLGGAAEGRAGRDGHGRRQAAAGLRLSRPDGLFSPDRQRGGDDRADGDGEQGDVGRLRRGAVPHHGGGPRDAARRPAHHADQPSGRGAGGAAAGAEVEGEMMRNLTPCRLLIDPPGDGAWNMAVDETLLEWAARENACCWRFYQWREPTLSLGYFQEYGHRGDHPASRGCPVVRRLTGGGAILHDAELTYSVVLPGGHPLAARRESLYQAAHESLVETLAGFGVVATLCRPAAGRPGAGAAALFPAAGSRRRVGGGDQSRRQRPASPPGRRAPARKRAVASFAGRPGTVRLGGRCRKGVRRRRPGPGVARTAGPTACRGLGAGRTIVGGGSPRRRAGPMPLRMPRMDATAGAIAAASRGDPDVDFGRQSDYIVGMEVKLIVVGGKQAGKEIPAAGPRFLIGRAEECQLRPRSDRVSRRHCEIFLEKGLAAIRDFGSKNGTFVNDERLQVARELKNGDHLKIGPLEFEVQLSVSVSGKRKPKVHNVQEAAARTVESAPGEELDVSNWLEDDDEEEARDATTETHSAPSASTTRLPVEKTPQKTPQPAPCAEEETKKTRPGSFLDREPGKKTAKDSREAAADMLKQFFHRRP